MHKKNFKNNMKNILSLLFLVLSASPAFAEASRETPVVQAVKAVSPAVVNINAEYFETTQQNPFSGFRGDPMMQEFFRDFFENGRPQREKRTSLGSGVIIDGQRGLVLTNAHVIERAGAIKVTMMDEREFDAEIVGSDVNSDLAVLKLNHSGTLPAVEMGRSDDLMIGETVIAIGNPFGFSNTVTTGVISALGRNIKTDNQTYHNFMQIDASINPGNSGGPLLNINGQLIGINTAIYASGQGIGFAIPINQAKRIINDLVKYGEVVPPWTGISVRPIDKRLANYLGSGKSGVAVGFVEKGSPAASAGIASGDIIFAVGGKSVQNPSEFQSLIMEYAPGDEIKLSMLKANEKTEIEIKSAVYPSGKAPELTYGLLGIEIKTAAMVSGQTIPGVVITKINPQSFLAGIGVRQGDLIRKIDGIKTDNTDEFYKVMMKSRHKSSVVLLVQRGGRGYYVTVNL
ncbi:Do family serine endopeptidase [Desulforegula conservatrix]|uniref:Do family serine endopeptidase n=1 Tax=Desulforegula conservatrix TaxID=153026 RepID=UPI00041EF9C9|nr:Do family serine endopeptidase [Desulforegula conservatrix]